MAHHGSDGAEDGGVAHQAGRQHKVSAAAAADTQETPVREKQVGGLGGFTWLLNTESVVTQWCFLRNSPEHMTRIPYHKGSMQMSENQLKN